MTIKTYANWTGDLYEYLKVGDIVDIEIYNHFVNVMPPACLNSGFVQMGEPYSHVDDKPTYETLARLDGNWTYCGHCHWGKIEVAKETSVTVNNDFYKITLNKETGCLMLKKGSGLIGYDFVNRFRLETMEISELMNEAKELAIRHGIHGKNEYMIDLN